MATVAKILKIKQDKLNGLISDEEYKDSLNVIKNNRTNVPYVQTINGEDYWFINGRLVSATKSAAFLPIDDNVIQSLNYRFTWNK